jgi:hypothetical protein
MKKKREEEERENEKRENERKSTLSIYCRLQEQYE